MYALVDGNNFYASCERVFLPALSTRPLVILSNNDGCAIARSNEAKSIGVPMGAPYFKIKHLEKTAGLVALSANFSLYGDMSDRMMSLAANLGHQQEIYSIDESFINLTGIRGNLAARSESTRSQIMQWIGIPTCIGIGPTKTLAKLANHIAKTAERKPGSYPLRHAHVCDLGTLSASERNHLLHTTDVGDVWGIGRKLSVQLRTQGIHTALDLSRMNANAAKSGWSVVLEKTVRELQGTACLGFDESPADKQQIAFTRSFGHSVTKWQDLQEAVTEFACRASEKLRNQNSHAGQVLVFIRTSPFKTEGDQDSQSASLPLPCPTSDSGHITQAAIALLRVIYRPGFEYAKAGVMLLDLQPANRLQMSLDLSTSAHSQQPDNRTRLMQTMDRINQRYGRGTLGLASAGLGGANRIWTMKQAHKTQAYTTDWNDLKRIQV
jgi:DNA polymerase V